MQLLLAALKNLSEHTQLTLSLIKKKSHFDSEESHFWGKSRVTKHLISRMIENSLVSKMMSRSQLDQNSNMNEQKKHRLEVIVTSYGRNKSWQNFKKT